MAANEGFEDDRNEEFENNRNEEFEDDIIQDNLESFSDRSQFDHDIKEAFFQVIVIVMTAIYVVCAYACFCNLLKFKKSLIINFYLIFIRYISYLIISFIIIRTLKINKSNHSSEPVTMRNTIILYFMIAPFLMVNWLKTTVESVVHMYLIHLKKGFDSSILKIFESFLVILILIMLNDIDKMISKNVTESQKWLNRLVAILIIASCFGIYLLEIAMNFKEIFQHRVESFYNISVYNITYTSTNILNIYKQYTSIATICFSICTIFYLLSLFSWLFSKSKNEIVQHEKISSKKGRFIFPTLVVVIIMTLTVLPLPFRSIHISDTNLNLSFEYISKITLILCYVSTIFFVFIMFQEVQQWENLQERSFSLTLHQLFIWSGLMGQILLFIGRSVDNIYIPLYRNQTDNNIKSLNDTFNTLGVFSVLFQTFLVDIMLKRKYQQHNEFSILYKIQPIMLLVGINLCCLINESSVRVWPDTSTTLSANLFADIFMMIGKELGLLQRMHAFFYFFSFLDKL